MEDKSLLGLVRGFFGSKRKLADVKLDELKNEKIRLKMEERKLLDKVSKLEDEKKLVFAEGVNKTSEREQRALARRIMDLDSQAKNIDRMLATIAKQERIINGLVQIKERARQTTESGLGSIIKNIDLENLIVYIDKATVDGEFQISKLDEMLGTLDQAEAAIPELGTDTTEDAIVRQMQLAKEASEGDVSAVEERFNEMNQEIKGKDLEPNEE